MKRIDREIEIIRCAIEALGVEPEIGMSNVGGK